MNKVLLELLSGALQTLGESKLLEILQQQHDKHLQQWKTTVYAGLALTAGLLPLVTGTKTKIDDAILRGLDEALRQSAKDNGLDPNVQVTVTAHE